MSDYKVALDVYNGPLDLLLFLIRREEVDIYDIPIARVTRQYLAYVEFLEEIDPEQVGEFLVLAATLMEIKSRTLLPRPPVQEDEEEFTDPRLELVRQLLEYKKIKDAARMLDDAAAKRAEQHARSPAMTREAPDEVELDNVDVWNLFDAFKNLLDQTGKVGPVHRVEIDDTPVALHAEDMVDSLQRSDGDQKFEDIFAGRTRAEMIGLFLALLELIRQHRVQVVQDRPFGEIRIHLLDARPLDQANGVQLGPLDHPPHTPQEETAHAGSVAQRPEEHPFGSAVGLVGEGGVKESTDDSAEAAVDADDMTEVRDETE